MRCLRGCADAHRDACMCEEDREVDDEDESEEKDAKPSKDAAARLKGTCKFSRCSLRASPLLSVWRSVHVAACLSCIHPEIASELAALDKKRAALVAEQAKLQGGAKKAVKKTPAKKRARAESEESD